MSVDSLFHFLGLVVEVFFIDLLLSGDNAVVIALACRHLPAEQMKRALLLGTMVAIIMRVLLTMVSSYLLLIPGLKLVGSMALIIIAIKLLIAEEKEEDYAGQEPNSKNMLSAIKIIIMADFAMSTDNVMALAAVAQGNYFILLLGLVISIPLLMYGSLFVTKLVNEFPLLIRAGGALLGWLAGHLAVSDPLFEPWVSTQAQSLPFIVPLLMAIFVLVQSRNIENEKKDRPSN